MKNRHIFIKNSFTIGTHDFFLKFQQNNLWRIFYLILNSFELKLIFFVILMNCINLSSICLKKKIYFYLCDNLFSLNLSKITEH